MMNPVNVFVLVHQSKFFGQDTNTVKHAHDQIPQKINIAIISRESWKTGRQ